MINDRNVFKYIDFGRMSQFIEKTFDLHCEPVIKALNKTILIPAFDSISQLTNDNHPNRVSQKKMLKHMYYQLKNTEFQRLHHQNQIQMKKQFELLKGKLSRQARHQTVEKEFEPKQSLPKLDLSVIIKMSPERIDLLKKNRGKIYGKLAVYQQAQKISKDKQSYQSWLDVTRNNPLKSPIFTKMNYLLEKLSAKQNNEKTIIQKTKNNHSKTRLTCKEMTRRTQNIINKSHYDL